MIEIKLNFVNRSNDTNDSQILIFQKNIAASADETAVAWTVIANCGRGWSHPFTFPAQNYASVGDNFGNISPQLAAVDGQSFSIINGPSGDEFKLTGNAADPHGIEISNALSSGAINANVYKDGRLLATKTGVAPGEKAAFKFEPTIHIGAVSQIPQGAIINSAILSQVNSQISLAGVQSADIVMTGGGPGPTSTPFIFTLQNVVFA